MARGDLVWNWQDALRGTHFALPAMVIIASGDVTLGVACGIGVLPAATIGLLPTRKKRLLLVFVGILVAASLLLGSLFAHNAVLAAVGLFLLALGAAKLAQKSSFGILVLSLCLPLAGIGLSIDETTTALGLGALIILGSIYAYILTVFWPESPGAPKQRASAALPAGYGLYLGLTAAITAGIGLVLHLDHPGWAAAAALFVMRPQADLQEMRSIARVIAVVFGSSAAIVFLQLHPSEFLISISVAVALTAAAATHKSRWYITPLFSTFIVFLMLLYSNLEDAPLRFIERSGETAFGVAVAYFFGLVLPWLLRLASTRRRSV